MAIEFVSYNGEYPNLCSGTLVVKIDGVEHSMKYVLCSGGRTCWTGEEDEVITGDWELDLYDYPELQPYEQEITALVNANVRKGCCGGCL